MVNCPQDSLWSSFRAIVSLTESPAWLHNDWLLSAFGNRKADAIDHYIKIVSDGLHQTSIWSDLKQQIYLGDDQFVERVQSLINQEQDLSEIPGAQSRPRAKPLNEYLRLEQDHNRAIVRAYHSGGYTLREIGACLNLHYSTVSIIVKKSKSKT